MVHVLDRHCRFGLSVGAQRMLLVGMCLLAEGRFDRFVAGATLQQLINGEFILAGDSKFSDWELLALDSTAAVTPDLSQIQVEPLVSDFSTPGLRFGGNGQLTVSGINSIEIVFRYRVFPLPGGNTYLNHALALTSINFGGNGGLAFVSDELIDPSGAGLDPTLVVADRESNFIQSTDTSTFAPKAGLSVITSVFITGLSTADAIDFASFTQTFSQTGPPDPLGDYNRDGFVDAADYIVWRDALDRIGVALAADGNENDRVDAADNDVWRAHFGQSVATGGLASLNFATPEPASWLLLALASVSGSLLSWSQGQRGLDVCRSISAASCGGYADGDVCQGSTYRCVQQRD
jgi:hypothetical protein